MTGQTYPHILINYALKGVSFNKLYFSQLDMDINEAQRHTRKKKKKSYSVPQVSFVELQISPLQSKRRRQRETFKLPVQIH